MGRLSFGMTCPAALSVVLAAAATRGAEAPARTDFYGDPLPPGVLARMGSVQLRHYGARLAFSADGRTLLSAGGTIRFWDVSSGRQLRETRLLGPVTVETGQRQRVVGLSLDGKLAASLADEMLYLFDTSTGKVRSIHHNGGGGGWLTFSGDGKRVAAIRHIKVLGVAGIRLWDTATGEELLRLRAERPADSLSLSADGKVLAFRDSERVLHLWDTDQKQERDKGEVEGDSWALSPDGRTIATVTHGQGVTLWETAGLKKQATLVPVTRVSWRAMEKDAPVFSNDGKLLAVRGTDSLVVWDVGARKERLRLPDGGTNELRFSPDGKILACAGEFEIRLWDLTKGERLHSRPGHDSFVRSVAFSPDGRTVASVAGDEHRVSLWDAATGKPLAPSSKFDCRIRHVVFAPDGGLLASGDDDVLRLLDPADGTERRRFVLQPVKELRPKQEVVVCQFSLDGEHLAAISLGWHRQLMLRCGQLTVWDARTGERETCRLFRGSLDSRLTPNGASVSVAGRERLVIEDTRTGEERAAFSGDLGDPVAFTRDGHLVAMGIHETMESFPGGPTGYRHLGLRLAEVATGQEIFHLDGSIEFAAISPDGRVLVTADADALCAWDMRTGEPLLRREWPEGFVRRPRWTAINALAFRPDGRTVVTGMNDGALLVWDLTPERGPKSRAGELGRKELDALWSDLAADARTGHRAVYALAAAPASALPYLAERLRPASPIDGKRVEKLLADLDSEQFTVREAAARELSEMGELVDPALRRALEGKPSLETRNRLRAIREALRSSPPAGTLRVLRAVRVLEAVGTPEARRILETLTSGAAEARETREAKSALRRLSAVKR